MTDVQTSAPRRRPSAGGYARGEETREKMILAAMRVFADQGFEGASTRRIAAEAGVTPPVLQYHFDSKEGLHRACGAYLVEQVMERLGPVMARARQALDAPGREAAVEGLCDLVTALTSAGMGKADMSEWRLFMTRAELDTAGPARAVFEQGVAEPLMEVAIALTARALGLDADGDEVRLRAMLIMGQVAAVTVKRQRTLQAMGWSDFDEAAQARVNAILTDHVRRLVRLDGVPPVAG